MINTKRKARMITTAVGSGPNSNGTLKKVTSKTFFDIFILIHCRCVIFILLQGLQGLNFVF